MSSQTIDLFRPPFWIALAAGIALLVPAVNPALRRWIGAAINFGVIVALLGIHAAWVAGGLGVAWLYLRLCERPGPRGFLAALGASATLALFLIHKRPELVGEIGPARINPILIAVGFSYVALRFFEASRAVIEGRHPAPGLAATVNYLIPFHMLAAGPIQSYDDFAAQPPVPPAPGMSTALRGVERVCLGMFKKYVLANVIELAFLTNFRATGPYFLLELQVNYLWLFLDFSAYSDIAVGAGLLMGVATPENFDRPYLARNMIDYWERWHITLSQFIRRNVFIPLQLTLMRATGGRAPLKIASFAFLISFLLCGLWHAIDVRWMIWGVLHGLGLTACNLYRFALTKRLGRRGVERYLANPWIRAAARVVTFEFVAVTVWIITAPWPGSH
ncbi:MAG TPA: MBOAT family O-acyltransferase [Isosphaeraceae bacterium]